MVLGGNSGSITLGGGVPVQLRNQYPNIDRHPIESPITTPTSMMLLQGYGKRFTICRS